MVLTGGSSGIGAAAASSLSVRGATVVASYRDAARAERAAAPARALGGKVIPLQLDLERSASIRTFAEEVLDLGTRIDVLVHNAGAVYRREKLTEEGLDAQAAVIFYGPLLLTHLLLPRLEATSRIVDVVSDLHRRARAEDLDRPAPYGFLRSYTLAELRKVLASRELARRLRPRGVDAHCVHPGGVSTRLFRDLGGPLGILFALANPLRMRTAAGARGIVHAAAEVPAGAGWSYLVNGRLGVRSGRPSRLTDDEALAARVYEEGCRRVGVAPLA